MRNLCDAASEVAYLLFQANANYGTWSIDFGYKVEEIKIDQKREATRDRAKEIISK
jgi:hypothetical protein